MVRKAIDFLAFYCGPIGQFCGWRHSLICGVGIPVLLSRNGGWLDFFLLFGRANNDPLQMKILGVGLTF